MKSLIIYHILSFLKKYKKYAFLYFFLILGFILFKRMIALPLDNTLFLDAIGMGGADDFISILYTILNIAFYILLIISIFIYDIRKTEDILLLRINIKKWVSSKIIASQVVTIFIISILHILLMILFLTGEVSFLNQLEYFGMHYLFISFIQLTFLMLYLIFIKYPYLIIFLGIMLVFSINKISIIVKFFLENDCLFLIIDILIYTFIQKIMKNNFIFFLEKES